MMRDYSFFFFLLPLIKHTHTTKVGNFEYGWLLDDIMVLMLHFLREIFAL